MEKNIRQIKKTPKTKCPWDKLQQNICNHMRWSYKIAYHMWKIKKAYIFKTIESTKKFKQLFNIFRIQRSAIYSTANRTCHQNIDVRSFRIFMKYVVNISRSWKFLIKIYSYKWASIYFVILLNTLNPLTLIIERQ